MTAGVTPEEKNAHKLTRKKSGPDRRSGSGVRSETEYTDRRNRSRKIHPDRFDQRGAWKEDIPRDDPDGETSALVELVFETENPHVLELLKEMDLEAEEGQVIISRKITGSRSVCRINGEACNISQVKALASLLLDIHGTSMSTSRCSIRTGRSRFLTRLREPRHARQKERSGRCTRSGRMSERSSRRTNSTRRQESGRQHFLRLKSTRLIRQS